MRMRLAGKIVLASLPIALAALLGDRLSGLDLPRGRQRPRRDCPRGDRRQRGDGLAENPVDRGAVGSSRLPRRAMTPPSAVSPPPAPNSMGPCFVSTPMHSPSGRPPLPTASKWRTGSLPISVRSRRTSTISVRSKTPTAADLQVYEDASKTSPRDRLADLAPDRRPHQSPRTHRLRGPGRGRLRLLRAGATGPWLPGRHRSDPRSRRRSPHRP